MAIRINGTRFLTSVSLTRGTRAMHQWLGCTSRESRVINPESTNYYVHFMYIWVSASLRKILHAHPSQILCMPKFRPQGFVSMNCEAWPKEGRVSSWWSPGLRRASGFTVRLGFVMFISLLAAPWIERSPQFVTHLWTRTGMTRSIGRTRNLQFHYRTTKNNDNIDQARGAGHTRRIAVVSSVGVAVVAHLYIQEKAN